jgi:hypothetical protein
MKLKTGMVNNAIIREQIAVGKLEEKFFREIRKFAKTIVNNGFCRGKARYIDGEHVIVWNIPSNIKNVRRLNTLKDIVWNRSRKFEILDDDIIVKYRVDALAGVIGCVTITDADNDSKLSFEIIGNWNNIGVKLDIEGKLTV